MRSFRFASPHSRLLSLLSLMVLLASAASAQTAAVKSAPSAMPDWETLRPDGEEFSVQMPKGSTFESGKEPYHKMEINTRTYISTVPAGVFAIVSLSGIKSNPALYTEMQRVNSYVDAFKDIFTPKVRKGTIAKLSLVKEKTLQGNAGREYKMVLGDLSGTAEVYATRRRFYAIVHLSTKKEEGIQKEFLSSFILPEKINAPPPEVAAATPPAATTRAESAEVQVKASANDRTDAKPENPDAGATVAAAGATKGPISGGVLNGKALSLPAPEYPAIAKQAKAAGAVAVQVTVDENGYVIVAHAASGHPLLQAAAVAAARQAKFSPTLLMGEPVKVTGVIVYNFGDASN